MIEKERALRDTLSSLGSVVVAYSGGVDSAYLAWIAHETLGDRSLAVTADSPSYPRRHREMAITIADRFGLRHEIIHTGELERPEYRANPANRCYYCKHELYSHLTPHRRSLAARSIVDGNNADDRGDYRPGPPGRARVRRAQPARRSRSRQGRDPRAVAARRPADLGRAGLGVPVVAHSVPPRGHRREAPDDRSGRAARCARSASVSAGSATTTSSPASSSGATRCRARSSPRWPPRSSNR